MASSTGGLFFGLSELIGSSESALKLIVSLLSGVPIAYAHRLYFYGSPPKVQHTFFILVGLALGYFNFGNDMIHPVLATFVTYLVLKILGGGTQTIAIVSVFNMLYLSIGYLYNATDEYDITWTMPQCVLTLKLIALAFNLGDGTIPDEKLSPDNKVTALKTMPSILEVFGYAFLPTAFLVGPQLSLRKYKQFVELKLEDRENKSEPPDSIKYGLRRLAQGILYISMYQLGYGFFSNEDLLSPDYQTLPFWWKVVKMSLWARLTLYKYIGCWLITEASCVILGLSYNGKDKNGEVLWDGCANVKLSVFENALRMNHYIESFNINTNAWVAQYIYKRLRFLNNRSLSQLGALLFLAVWHGFHSGYYYTFYMEFIVIHNEKNLYDAIIRNGKLVDILWNERVRPFTQILLRLYTNTCMGYCLVPFALFSFEQYYYVHGAVYHYWALTLTPLLFLLPYITRILLPTPRREHSE